MALGDCRPLALIAGPCVIESESHALELAMAVTAIGDRTGVPLIFKVSFDKANRTSGRSYRGPGLQAGLKVLRRIREDCDIPILTDIHEPWQAAPAAEVADVLQIPALLARQTDLLEAAAATGKPVNLKKGQFMAPQDMRHAIGKVVAAGSDNILLTERGTCFGYHNLVVDMRALPIMRALGYPVVLDATHSVQLPGGGDGKSAGNPEFIATLAAAGVAAGVDGLFLEVHDNPAAALSDGPNSLPLDQLEPLLERLLAIAEAAGRTASMASGSAP